MGAIYGRPLVDSSTDAMVAHINELVHTLTRSATPGAHLVEVFPSMLYIPECFAKWKRDGKKLHKYWSTVLHDFTMEVQYKAVSHYQKQRYHDLIVWVSNRVSLFHAWWPTFWRTQTSMT